jgi:hypothetical protein
VTATTGDFPVLPVTSGKPCVALAYRRPQVSTVPPPTHVAAIQDAAGAGTSLIVSVGTGNP